MPLRRRWAKWPSWTRQNEKQADDTKLSEPFRSTLRRIDEQFLSINSVIIEAYANIPALKRFDRADRISMLEQDKPYHDNSDSDVDKFEDIALLGRLADLVCPEVWTTFFSDINELLYNAESHYDTSRFDDPLSIICRRWERAAELYESVRDEIRSKQLRKAGFGIETKIDLLLNLLVINGALERLNQTVSLYMAQDAKEAFSTTMDIMLRRIARKDKTSVQRLTPNVGLPYARTIRSNIDCSTGCRNLDRSNFIDCVPLYAVVVARMDRVL